MKYSTMHYGTDFPGDEVTITSQLAFFGRLSP